MNLSRALTVLLLVCAAFGSPCFGREICYLTNGFQIEGISHTIDHDLLALKTVSGSMEFPLAEIYRIEEVADPDSFTAPAAVATQQILQEAAEAEGLPAALVRSVAKMESAYNPKAVSVKGAVGLMQLMPTTAAALRVKAARPQENALGGAKYLRDLLLHYNGNAALALAAYNAGPGAVTRYGGVPPYAETRQYVERVLREFLQQQKQMRLTSNSAAAPRNAAKTPTATN
jgi:soluble lytic murein transglycosylase-like protein